MSSSRDRGVTWACISLATYRRGVKLANHSSSASYFDHPAFPAPALRLVLSGIGWEKKLAPLAAPLVCCRIGPELFGKRSVSTGGGSLQESGVSGTGLEPHVRLAVSARQALCGAPTRRVNEVYAAVLHLEGRAHGRGRRLVSVPLQSGAAPSALPGEAHCRAGHSQRSGLRRSEEPELRVELAIVVLGFGQSGSTAASLQPEYHTGRSALTGHLRTDRPPAH
ncbi:hypothetical protein SRHO_G00243860 [Serrasalmus rhombeus]